MEVAVLSRDTVRELDRCAIEQYHIPGMVLMENAGRGVADVLCHQRTAASAVVCCGRGNNAGDGFVIARHLHNAGVPCKAILFAAPEKYRGDAKTNLRIVEKLDVSIVQFASDWTDERTLEQLSKIGRDSATWVVDAMLGPTGNLRAPTIRKGKKIIVGFNEDVFSEHLL